MMKMLQILDPDEFIVDFNVGKCEFCDLLNDGWLELIIPVDTSRRGLYNSLVIVHQEGNTLKAQELDGWGVLPLQILHLSQNGESQIVVPNLVDFKDAGTDPLAVFPHVYAWNGRKFVKSDAHFRSYYRQVVLPDLKHRLATPELFKTEGRPEMVPLWTKVYKKEIAAVKAFLRKTGAQR